MGLKETLDLIMKYPRIKTIAYGEVPGKYPEIVNIELYPDQPQVQTSQFPMINDMPPDDIMQFAATEDIDELLKQRKAD